MDLRTDHTPRVAMGAAHGPHVDRQVLRRRTLRTTGRLLFCQMQLSGPGRRQTHPTALWRRQAASPPQGARSQSGAVEPLSQEAG